MSIKKKLETVISSINDFSKQTNMVAINASIYASRLSNSEGAPFQVLAKEIQSMSSRSIDKLEELDALMDYITKLSTLINMVGSQRMLLMKMILGNTMNNCKISSQSTALFEANLYEIEASELNTSNTTEIIPDQSPKPTKVSPFPISGSHLSPSCPSPTPSCPSPLPGSTEAFSTLESPITDPPSTPVAATDAVKVTFAADLRRFPDAGPGAIFTTEHRNITQCDAMQRNARGWGGWEGWG